MTASTNNNFQNYSGPAGLNRGGNGKFTPSQTQDRIKVHAISIATGTPTLAQIVNLWKEKYNIDITLPSEKEWRGSNREIIEKKKLELVENGEIAIPIISEEVLSDSLLNNAIQTSDLLKKMRKKTRLLLQTIDVEKDGGTDKFKDRLALLKAYATIAHQLDKNFTDQTLKLFAMSGKIKVKDQQITKLVDIRFQERYEKAQEGEDDIADPMEMEVNDEMREKLGLS